MSTFELIIVMLLVLYNTFLFLMTRILEGEEDKHGKSYNIVTSHALSNIIFAFYVIFLIFYLFVSFDKLHLRYIYLLVYFIITYKMTKRVIKRFTREDKK